MSSFWGSIRKVYTSVKKVFPELDPVGWYCSGDNSPPAVDEIHVHRYDLVFLSGFPQVHGLFSRQFSGLMYYPLMMKYDVTAAGTEVKVRVYLMFS